MVLLCCGLMAACSANKDPQFPIEETIVQELMPLQGVTNPLLVNVEYPYLILENLDRVDSIYHIYDIRNHELKSVFGIVGRGPGEFSGYTRLLHTPLEDILVLDINENIIFRYGIDKGGLPVPKGSIQAKFSGYLIDPVFISDSLYAFDADSNLEIRSLYDELPRKSRPYRNPDILDPDFDPNMGFVYANANCIAFCYGYKKQIDFMDTELNLIKSVKFEYAPPANVESGRQWDTKLSYINSYFGKRYCYNLFVGASMNEYKLPSFRGALLEVFDLEGNPVAKYHLDGITPECFAIDEENFTLYGLLETSDLEDQLLVYKLRGLS